MLKIANGALLLDITRCWRDLQYVSTRYQGVVRMLATLYRPIFLIDFALAELSAARYQTTMVQKWEPYATSGRV
jgi:hypothetical protein